MVAGAAAKGAAKFFDIGEMAVSRREATNFLRPAVQGVGKFLKENLEDKDFGGAGKYIHKAASKIHHSSTLTGAVYGGTAGGAMGLTSSDRDIGFWKGATMGAIAGARTMRGGISAGALTGGVGGAVWGGFSNDTSIIGGAFTGAALGGVGLKYGRGFNAIRGIKARGKTQNSKWGGKTRGKDSGGGWGKATRATAKAIKKDIGRSWRGKRSRASKASTTQGSNRGV